MPNCVIFIGTNHGGDSLAGTSTTNILVAQSLLTTVHTHWKKLRALRKGALGTNGLINKYIARVAKTEMHDGCVI